MISFKSFYEDLTFKVEVEGLPAMWMSGNSPGQVKNHLRKLIKQPSMIKSVKRQTKHDVKKMYRKKAQGKEVEEMTQQSKTHPNLKIAVGKSAQSAKDTKARADKRKANKQGTSLAAGTACESTVNELDQKTMNSYYGKAQRSKDRATNSAVATILRKGDHSKDLQTRNKRDKGMALAKSRTIKKMRGEATSGEVDYGSDKSVKMIKKVTPNEAQEGKKGLWANIHAKRKRGERMRKKGEKGAPTPAAIKSAQKEDADRNARIQSTIDRHANTMKVHKAEFKKTGNPKHMNAFKDAKKSHDIAVQKQGHGKMEDVKEKLTIGKIRRAAYKTARGLGDVSAVTSKRKGSVTRRVKNRVVGKLLGKAVNKLGLFK